MKKKKKEKIIKNLEEKGLLVNDKKLTTPITDILDDILNKKINKNKSDVDNIISILRVKYG